MKALRVDFIPSSQPYYWTLASIVLSLTVLGWSAVRWEKDTREEKSLRAQILLDQEKIRRIVDQQKKVDDPFSVDRAKSRSHMAIDLNGIFATIEHVSAPGIRLSGINVNVLQDQVNLNYALDSINKIPLVGFRLNAGYETPPWLFNSGSTATRPQPNPSLAGASASWSASLSKL